MRLDPTRGCFRLIGLAHLCADTACTQASDGVRQSLSI